MTLAIAQMAGVALVWWLLYGLNQLLFAGAFVNEYISWVFLPAALRLVAVLLFGWRGVVGLFLGALATQESSPEDQPLHGVILAAISALAPWAATRLGLRLMSIPRDLAGLRLAQLAMLAAASAGTSVALHHAYLLGIRHGSFGLQGLGPMFVGDLVGMLILGYLGAWLLRRWR